MIGHIGEQVQMLAGASGTASSTPLTTGFAAIERFDELLACFRLGNMADSETATLQLVQATSSAGAGAKPLATRTLVAGAGNDNTNHTVGGFAGRLDHAGGFTHVAARVTTNGATGGPVAIVLLGAAKYKPAPVTIE